MGSKRVVSGLRQSRNVCWVFLYGCGRHSGGQISEGFFSSINCTQSVYFLKVKSVNTYN